MQAVNVFHGESGAPGFHHTVMFIGKKSIHHDE